MLSSQTRLIRLRAIACLLLIATAFHSNAQTDWNQRFDLIKSLLPDKVEEADRDAAILLRDAMTQSCDSMIARAHYLLGLTGYYESRFIVAGKHYREALHSDYAEKNLSFREACWNNLGIIFEKQVRIVEARDAYFKSLKIAESVGDSSSMMQSLINIGWLDRMSAKKEESALNLQIALDYFTRHRDTFNMALCHQNLSDIVHLSPMNVQYENHTNAAIEAYKSLGYSRGVIGMLLKQADRLSLQGKYTESNRIISEVEEGYEVDLFPELNHTLKGIVVHNSIGTGDNLEKAGVILSGMETELLATGDIGRLIVNKFDHARLYARLGDYEKFDKILMEGLSLIDEKSNRQSKSLYEELGVLYNMDVLQKEKDELDRDIGKRKNQIILLVAGLLVTLLITGIMFRMYLNIRQKNKVLYRVNVELSRSTAAMLASEEESPSDYSEMDEEQDEEKPLVNLYNAIMRFISREKPYLDPNFNILTLCEMMKRSERYVSLAINKQGKTTFTRLVTDLRVNEARRLIMEHGGSLQMNEIAERSGFANRVSFNRSFKQVTGLTPTDYLQMSLSAETKLQED